MYIYENHMGGLYSSDYQLDFDDLYCEQCGDSDWELGNYETPEELWEDIKPYDLCCIGCKKEDICEEDCELVEESNYSSYDLLYNMSFLAGNFDIENYRYVYLICEDNKSKTIFSAFKPHGHKFGEYHSIPNSFSLNKDLDYKVAISLVPTTCELIKKPYKIKTIKKNNIEYIIYKCIVNKSEDDNLDSAYYYDDNWYGWLDTKSYHCLPEERFLKDIL